MLLKAISFLGLLTALILSGTPEIEAQSNSKAKGTEKSALQGRTTGRGSSFTVSPLRKLGSKRQKTNLVISSTKRAITAAEKVVGANSVVKKLSPAQFIPAAPKNGSPKTKMAAIVVQPSKPVTKKADQEVKVPVSKAKSAHRKSTPSKATTAKKSKQTSFSKEDLLRMSGQSSPQTSKKPTAKIKKPQEEKPLRKKAPRKTIKKQPAVDSIPDAETKEVATKPQETPKAKKAPVALNETSTKLQRKSIDYDVVLLKNGQEFVGRVTHEDDKRVTVLFRGGEIVLPKSRIKEIIRAERAEVERRAATETVVLGRYEEREEFYFVYYRGRRVGWRKTSVTPEVDQDKRGYRFLNRTVFLKKNGRLDMDMNVSEFVDSDLRPVSLLTMEESENYGHPISGVVSRGHLEIKEGSGESQATREILFGDETEFLQPLVRKLADLSHFPEAGETFKVFDSQRSQFIMVHASRSPRKEIVAGKHQFVTVWKLQQGKRVWEIWIDGYGGLVREELGGPHMVALRAKPELVLAYARGEAKDGDGADITLEYENVPDKFRLSRPNLTWSFEFPEFDSPVAITLLNPTLQASADVIVLDHVEAGMAPETMALDLMSRMHRKSDAHKILFQKTGNLGGSVGIQFESTGERKGTVIRTIGAISVTNGRAYAVLLAAPAFSFDKVRGQLERILDSFEILGSEGQLDN
ncbi:MAG: hypothetical protein ACI97A_003766 [Planctomycetota bacterium]|jgi:hypothetical protein